MKPTAENRKVQYQRLKFSNLLLLIGLEVFLLLAVFINRNPLLISLAVLVGCFCVVAVVYRFQSTIKPEDLEDPHALREKTYSGADSTVIRIMDRRSFLALVQRIYASYGFQVTPDGQLLEARLGKKITLIEPLRRYEPIDLSELTAFHREMVKRKAEKGIVISTSGFLYKARKFARETGIQLIGIDELMEMIDHVQSVKEERIM